VLAIDIGQPSIAAAQQRRRDIPMLILKTIFEDAVWQRTTLIAEHATNPFRTVNKWIAIALIAINFVVASHFF
jgi:hypothetical protein